MEPKDVVGIITGAAGGFGRGFAERVLAAGGKVLITDINVRELQATGKALERQYGAKHVIWLRQDVTDADSFARVYEYATSFFGLPVNLFVNNAGIGDMHAFYDGLNKNWEKVLDIDLTAVVRGTQFAIAQMKKTLNGREGVIVNIASMAGLNATPFSPEYAAAKAGVVGLTRSLYQLKKTDNIRAFALCPAFADTAMGRLAVEGIPEYTQEMDGLMPIDVVLDAFVEALREPDNAGRVLRILKTKRTYYHFAGDRHLFPNSKL